MIENKFLSLIDLKGKTALVCGASEGIGLASAKMLADMGANIILLSRNQEKLAKALTQLIKNDYQNHQALAIDLSDINKILASKNYLEQQKVDILINNAGGPAPNTTQNAENQDYLHAFTTHVLASSELSKIVLTNMIANSWGRIVNIIGISAKTPLPNLAVSNTIRAAVVNWAKTLSNEVAIHNITVNNVLPSYTNTARFEEVNQQRAKNLGLSPQEIREKILQQVPMQRAANPNEIASVVAFFCSQLSSFVTGQSLCADGGLSSWS
jgi:3-oxoacyl-[acyl-carrier protein] reductase